MIAFTEEALNGKYHFLCSEYALADERITIKKKEISSYLVYNFVSLGKVTGKADTFSWR